MRRVLGYVYENFIEDANFVEPRERSEVSEQNPVPIEEVDPAAVGASEGYNEDGSEIFTDPEGPASPEAVDENAPPPVPTGFPEGTVWEEREDGLVLVVPNVASGSEEVQAPAEETPEGQGTGAAPEGPASADERSPEEIALERQGLE